MSSNIKIFLKTIATSLQPNSYYHIVSSPKKLGETTTKINTKREKNHNRINRVVNERIRELTREY